MTLVDMPFELLVSILLYLDFRDVLRCREVCSGMKHVVDEDIRMRYKIELAAAGMEDGKHSKLTISERLTSLMERQRAWRTLTWSSQTIIRRKARLSTCKFISGILAYRELDGDNGRLHFHRLPSRVRRIEEKRWSLDVLGMDIYDFVSDSTQDLLVILEEVRRGPGMLCHIHFRSLETGLSHPDATSGALMHDVGTLYSYSMQVSNDYLALFQTTADRRTFGRTSDLLVWNWKTGDLHMHVNDNENGSFSFMVPRYILLLTCMDITLTDNRTAFSKPCLIVLDLDKASHCEQVRTADLDYLCAFAYPPLSTQFNIWETTLCSAPGPDSLPTPSLSVPFSVSRNDRLFVATFEVQSRHGTGGYNLISLIPSTTLMSAIQSLSPGQTRRIFPWQDWGPTGSRLLVDRQLHERDALVHAWDVLRIPASSPTWTSI
ncbi:hypothetical protein L226DRAFT_461076 [Lentinus tigrinus ALCF2SS1-7]|uniref:F-box domain-containing protein n=1 Tax=Lentinus tigrinus ALCF2SS1-6 TaxID=1328759 RepID=A0A5C2SDA9_9APHY|nr:hypothetical protein L227DRAFT_500125 [Lentinus tigrinus ALCF2SS1-6]RPD76040.1 hypothetical protein L226DRAFT_461076 [Lentinus tigrinus ALCF2SS1-7]